MTTLLKTLVAAAATAALLTATGCSTAPSEIKGPELAKRVNKELIKKIEPVSSTLTCPTIAYKKGASVTCTQTEVLDAGRQLEVPVTVTLTKAEDSGSYAYDFQQADKPTKFGVAGSFIEKDLKTQWDQQKGGTATVTCPKYLAGVVGTSIECKLTDAGTDHTIKVTVDKIDEANYNPNYTFAEV